MCWTKAEKSFKSTDYSREMLVSSVIEPVKHCCHQHQIIRQSHPTLCALNCYHQRRSNDYILQHTQFIINLNVTDNSYHY
uniref:Uncharacterized protein n=1 Tax=Arion vulgaris TaxID=1028688 RepID=A0A0B7B452_9EUPU